MKTNDNQRGAALLTTLLIMAVMAALSVAIVDDVRFALKRAANVQSYAQADWYLLGAEDFARQYVQTQVRTQSPQVLNAALSKPKPLIFPVEGGRMKVRIRDGGSCFSLGELADVQGIGRPQGQKRFAKLLGFLGWGNGAATHLAATATDWVDRDFQAQSHGAEDYAYLGLSSAHRTANTAFTSTDELRALQGMDEAGFQALLPYVCARPLGTLSQININGLTLAYAPLLAAFLGQKQPLLTAQRLIGERPQNGYQTMDQLRAAPALKEHDVKNAALGQIDFKPVYFWVEVTVELGPLRRFGAFAYAITPSGRVVRSYRRYGEEAFWPTAQAKSS